MNRFARYILADKIPIECGDLLTWARWMEGADRVVKQEDLCDYWISTCFLGLDHNFSGDDSSAPILFETIVFHGWTEFNGRQIRASTDYQARYSTWDEAEMGHLRALRYVQELIAKKAKELS